MPLESKSGFSIGFGGKSSRKSLIESVSSADPFGFYALSW
jgi:hypothetical protein